MKSVIYSVVLSAALTLSWTTANANVGIFSTESALIGPHATADSPLEVVSETLEIVCEGPAKAPTCTFEAIYTIRNPTDTPERATAAFYGIESRDVSVSLDGKDVVRALSDEERALLDKRVDRVTDNLRLAVGEDTDRTGFDIAVGPGQTRVLVCKGGINPGFFELGSYAVPAPKMRHIFLGDDHRETRTRTLSYALAPIRTWAAVGPIEISVTIPSDWDTRAFFSTSEAQSPEWASTSQGGKTTLTTTIDANDADVLSIEADIPQSPFYNGGPFLGLGGTFGKGGGFRLRAGYEVAAPQWLIYSLGAETDFDDTLTIVPTVEAATPGLFIIPSLAVGLGAPVRVSPETAAGVRLQGTVAFPLLSFVVMLDAFPTEDDVFQTTLMGQVSF